MDGRCTHEQYYGQIAQRAGVVIPEALMARVRKSQDEHYNDIHLPTWDIEGMHWRTAISAALKDAGDFWSMGMSVCTLKEAARRQYIAERLEYLRGELRAERISYWELAELAGYKEYIAADDVELLEAAGVEEVIN